MTKYLAKNILFFILLLGYLNLAAQEGEVSLLPVNISQGTYKQKLTTKRGNIDIFSNYRVFNNSKETNSIWLSYVAGFDGEFSVEVDAGNEEIVFAVFNAASGDIGSDIASGKAPILRVLVDSKPGKVGLSKSDNIPVSNKLYPLKLKQGEEILVYINAKNSSVRDVLVRVDLQPDNTNITSDLEQKTLDLRKDDFLNMLHVKVRDAETGLPLIASVNISGMKGISNYYVASDLFFDIERTKDIEIKSDVEGYFFFFKSFKVMDDIDNEIVVLMERLKEGKKLGLPEIQFEMGTSNPTGNAIQLMNRLAEFLLSNPEVRIEIGGHVNEVGDNSHAAKKISEARAKRVYSYLIEKGVDKHRLEYKGFGNTEMIYPIPKNHFEEQANRRVEIRIL